MKRWERAIANMRATLSYGREALVSQLGRRAAALSAALPVAIYAPVLDHLDAELGALHRELTDAETVSQADLAPMDSPLLEAMLDHRDRLFRPVFVVNIHLPQSQIIPADAPSSPASVSYYLKFSGRQTVWKYYLLGDLAREEEQRASE